MKDLPPERADSRQERLAAEMVAAAAVSYSKIAI
jgi:hypothetical protein